MPNLFNFTLTHHYGTPIDGVVHFGSYGSKVYLDDGNVYSSEATKVDNVANFLVMLFHYRGYNKPIVVVDGVKSEYEDVQDSNEYTTLDYNGETHRFDGDATLGDLAERLGTDASVSEITNIKATSDYRFTKNEAINKILNYNNFTPEYVKRRGLIEIIHDKVLKGHTTIPDGMSGSVYTLYGTKALNANSTKNKIVIP